MATETAPPPLPKVWVWGVPFAPLTFAQTLDRVDELIKYGQPRYFITANVHYAMLTAADPRLGPVNEGADFIVADGKPLVVATRWREQRLPERVTGSDLLPLLCERAAQKGHRVFFLGAAPGVAEAAAKILCERYPGLQVAGIEVPPFRPLTPEEHQQQIDRIRAAKPDLLFIAFGQPRGEIWMAEHCQALGVPVSVQVGGTFDFVAGRIKRAPRWVQKVGLEFVYRFLQEPRRLGGRYFRNGLFVLRMLLRDATTRRANRR